MDLSIVIPCYCSGNNISYVLNEIDDVLKNTKFSYEIIMVNDGSPDNTFEIIKKLSIKRKNTIAINLSKNSGQHAAIMAGFRIASGKYVATCEDDGQTQISILPQMIDKMINDDYDVVAPIYKERGKRTVGRRIGTCLATVMANWMIPRPKGILVPIYFVAKRFVIEEIIKYNQPYPYIEGLVLRSTYNIFLIESSQRERIGGKSGYNLKKMFNLWLNGFTSFSIKPLRISVVIGFFSALIGFFTGLFLIINKLINNNVLLGWSSIISIMLFMFGIVLIVLGMIGEYIGRIYLCINNTPQYVIKEVFYSSQTGTKDINKSNEVKIINNYSRKLFTEFNHKIAENEQNFTELEKSVDKFIKYGNIIGLIDDNKLIAMLNLYCNNYETKEAYICNVYVLNEYRRKGLAKKMLQESYRICENSNFSKLFLHVDEDNVNAINLYLSEGFVFTGNYKKIGNILTKEMIKNI